MKGGRLREGLLYIETVTLTLFNLLKYIAHGIIVVINSFFTIITFHVLGAGSCQKIALFRYTLPIMMTCWMNRNDQQQCIYPQTNRNKNSTEPI